MNKQTFDNPFCKFNVLFSRRLFSKVFVLHLMTKSYFCNVFLDLRSALHGVPFPRPSKLDVYTVKAFLGQS
jgi:hypothetical protein